MGERSSSDEIEALRLELLEARNSFRTIYEAAENGRNDEVLLTAGAMEARMQKVLETSWPETLQGSEETEDPE